MRFNAAPEFRGVATSLRCLQPVTAAMAAVISFFTATAVFAAELDRWTGGETPRLTLDALDGPAADLADFHGNVVLVHFFATWCEPCVEETGSLNRLVDRTAGRPLKVLAVNVGEIDARVRTFTRENPVKFTILMDRDRAAMKAWGVEGLPATFVLDRGLAIRLSTKADMNWDRPDINAALEHLIVQSTDMPEKPAAGN